jgi:hypothetical protein
MHARPMCTVQYACTGMAIMAVLSTMHRHQLHRSRVMPPLRALVTVQD